MAARDENALIELRLRYGTTAYATAYTMVADPEQAEAAVSAAFGRAWSRAREQAMHSTGGIAGWIGQLVREAARQLQSP